VKYLLTVLVAAILVWGLPAQASNFQENIHYSSILPEPPHGKVGDKIEVVEFFMYKCPACYRFEPTVEAWKANKAEDVEFVPVPAMFGGAANLHAKAYYALQAIGEGERVHEAFFREIHENKNKLETVKAIEDFVESQGVDLKKFQNAMGKKNAMGKTSPEYFSVSMKTNNALRLLRHYGVRSVPSLVIDGRYRSNRGLSYKGMVELADHLVDEIRNQRKEAR
jgi:thiol:disulfide interchange protein DsbA